MNFTNDDMMIKGIMSFLEVKHGIGSGTRVCARTIKGKAHPMCKALEVPILPRPNFQARHTY